MNASADMTKNTRRITYFLVGGIILVLCVVGLVAYNSNKETQAAEQKADQLLATLEQAGLPTPSRDQVVRVLGDDGGTVCADPNLALKKAIMYGLATNGAAGPGLRPVVADNLLVQAGVAVIRTYCPEELPEFPQTAEQLKTANLVNR
jgi:hypothetical protein